MIPAHPLSPHAPFSLVILSEEVVHKEDDFAVAGSLRSSRGCRQQNPSLVPYVKQIDIYETLVSLLSSVPPVVKV
jgi:hypothetical protein